MNTIRIDRIRAEIRSGLDGCEGPQLVVPMTCMLDGREHAVTELGFERRTHGRYRALCGAWVCPGSLFSPPGQPCMACVAVVASKPVGRAVASRQWPVGTLRTRLVVAHVRGGRRGRNWKP
ncbi:hypothetical protein GCM10023321_30270 [Pseudonocardia eucalypti]|uniref:Uncharacterized protein n=1 Tax=Pseudonocardia eucalypti TaxID=648755 RepID=A0ABP9Q683_9PSEU|nr:hypothetical protein [Pseudonocardia eucalypti]